MADELSLDRLRISRPPLSEEDACCRCSRLSPNTYLRPRLLTLESITVRIFLRDRAPDFATVDDLREEVHPYDPVT